MAAVKSLSRCSATSRLARPAARRAPAARRSVTVRAFKVTVVDPEAGNKETTFECAPDVYIIDAAEDAGVDLPFSCRAGSCSTCAAKLVSGNLPSTADATFDVDQTKGFFLSCVAYPTSDCTILIHQEDKM